MKKKSPWKAIGLVVGSLFLFFLLLFAATLYLGKGYSFGRDKVALINIEGILVDSKEVVEQLEKFKENVTVKAYVIRINSPGGGVAVAQEIYKEIQKVREVHRKPVIASMATIAASGGYYIASAADRIIANPGSVTGSIGVIMQIPNVSGLLQKVGIKSVVIKSGEHKDLASSTRELTDEEKRILQQVLDDVHDQFIEAVAKGRKMDKGKVQALADGRIFTGRQALNLGLVDELGDLQDAIEKAAKIGGIVGKPKVIQERKRRLSLLDFLTGVLGTHLPNQASPYFSLDYLLK